MKNGFRIVPILLVAFSISSVCVHEEAAGQGREVLQTPAFTPGPDARVAEDQDPARLRAHRPPRDMTEAARTWQSIFENPVARRSALAPPRERHRPGGSGEKSDPTTGANDVIFGDDIVLARVAIDQNGDIYVALGRTDFTLGGDWIEVLVSRDGGDRFATWGSIGFADGIDQILDDLEVAEGAVDRLFVTYRHWDLGLVAFDGRVSFSDLSTPMAVWTESVIFSDPDVAFDFGDLTSDDVAFPGYYLYAVISGRDNNGDDVWFSRSTDFGVTWSTPYRIAEQNSDPNIHYRDPTVSYGFGGNVHVSFVLSETLNDTFDDPIRYRRATSYADLGLASWDPILEITAEDDGRESRNLDIEASASGNTVLILYQERVNEPLHIVRASYDAGVTWPAGNVTMTELELGGDLQYRVATDEFIAAGLSFSDFNPIAYYDRAFRVTPAANPLVWGPKQILSDASESGVISMRTQVALDPTRGDRVGQIWNRFEGSLGAGFDAEWRGDAGFPTLDFEVDLDVTAYVSAPTSPVVVDVDADPFLEILFSDHEGRVRLFSHIGTEVGGWPVDVGNVPVKGQVAVGDLDGDDQPEIVVGNTTGQVHAYRPDGTTVSGFPVDLGTGGDTFVAIGALGGPDPREIVATSGDRIFILDHAGEVQNSPWIFTGLFSTPVAIGDIDEDGTTEIVSVNGTFVHALTRDAAGAEMFRNFPGEFINQGPVLGDLDLDGDLEIAFPSLDGEVRVIHHDGSDFAGAWPFSFPEGGAPTRIALADFLGQDEPELAFGQELWRVHALFADGVEQPAYPKETTPGSLLLGGPIIDLVNRPSGNLTVGALDALGWSFQNTGGTPSGWPKDLIDQCEVEAASGDIDLDGDNEYIFLTSSSLLALDVNNPPQTVAFKRWPMSGHDPQRTACLDCPEDVATPVAPGGPTLTRVSFAPVAPNPVSGSSVFRYALAADAAVQLEIFDLRGRRLRTVVKAEQSRGERAVAFDGRDQGGRPLAAGQYLARLSVRGPGLREVVTRKFSVVR